MLNSTALDLSHYVPPVLEMDLMMLPTMLSMCLTRLPSTAHSCAPNHEDGNLCRDLPSEHYLLHWAVLRTLQTAFHCPHAEVVHFFLLFSSQSVPSLAGRRRFAHGHDKPRSVQSSTRVHKVASEDTTNQLQLCWPLDSQLLIPGERVSHKCS